MASCTCAPSPQALGPVVSPRRLADNGRGPCGGARRWGDLPTYDTGCDLAIETVNPSHAGAGYLSRADTRTWSFARERLAAVQ